MDMLGIGPSVRFTGTVKVPRVPASYSVCRKATSLPPGILNLNRGLGLLPMTGALAGVTQVSYRLEHRRTVRTACYAFSSHD